MNTSSTTDSQPLPRLGIDISKATVDVCLILLDLSIQRHRFSNDAKGFAQLQTWLVRQKAPCVLAGMEATGCYALALLKFLHQQKHQVCLLNARHVKDFARSQGHKVKTDKADAHIIAVFLRYNEHLKRWQPMSEDLVQLQALVRRRQQLMQDLQSEKNRLEDPQMTRLVKRDIQQHIRQLTTHLKDATKAIDGHVLKSPVLQKQVALLRSIPGIGLQVAVTLLVEIP